MRGSSPWAEAEISPEYYVLPAGVGEYFNVQPYAKAAGDYLMHFIKAEKMPRS